MSIFKLHDTLAKIEIAVKSEVEGMHFDRKVVKEAILAVANPKKSDAVKKARKAEEDARFNPRHKLTWDDVERELVTTIIFGPRSSRQQQRVRL